MNPNYCNADVVWPPWVPKDGMGPRGAPDCYYTSRVLKSTANYVLFVKKLRAAEEEEERGKLLYKKETQDQQRIDFFKKCDRKLKVLLNDEEERDMWMLTKKAQSANDVIWQGKMEKLARLLAKSQAEHEARVKDPPLSKCSHVMPCIIKLRAKEAEEIQLYQMREKQLRKEAQKEMDKMWHEVTMKESEALAARMEYVVIERLRRDKESAKQALQQIEMNKVKRAKEQEMLKREVMRMKADFEEGERKEREAEEKRQMEILKTNEELTNDVIKRREVIAELQAKEKLVNDVWESLAGQSLADDKAKEAARRQKRRELDECNTKMVAMKNRIADMRYDNDPMILEEGKRRLDAYELKRCQHTALLKKRFVDTQKENKLLVDMNEEGELRKAEEMKQAEYNRQLSVQLDELVRNKQMTEAQARKLHQNDVLKQTEYNQQLKDRVRQEALEQDKKCKIAMGQYQEQITKMLSRPFFSDAINPFMRQMASGLTMKHRCPCDTSYCLHQSHEKPRTGI